MFESFICYVNCLWGTSLGYLMLGLVIVIIIALLAFFFTYKPESMFTAQISTSAIIVTGFIGMKCPMIDLIWFYLAAILVGLFILAQLHMGFLKRIERMLLPLDKEAEILDRYSLNHDDPVHLLDSQRLQAFTCRGAIYISVGLLEILEPNELRAVIAHEAYHLGHTPDRRIAASLAIISLWFHSFRDERSADRYAATLVGEKPLVSALRKLGVRGYRKRVMVIVNG